ncbi:hypothetical protein DERP_005071 [Dermatophagoides pteronyssinus]|uniref:Uncharacterized protein n=1 Tax=Dermatophagoides pteronyssinus TaxID=6956 RepID=A0ABQ8JTF9_DERPT|nr:hypothetical protein DERP_005071 [Dermatophagoides pteronyssinus]
MYGKERNPKPSTSYSSKISYLCEIVQVDLQTGLKLSAFILQATYGDCNNFNEIKIRNRIHRLQLISSNLLAELTSYQIW